MDLVNEYPYTVDLARGTVRETIDSPLVCGDVSAHRLLIRVQSAGVDAVMTGATVQVYAVRRSDQVSVLNTGGVSTDAPQYIYCTLNQASLAVPSVLDILVRISRDGRVYTPLLLSATCTGGVTDAIVDNDNLIPSLDALLAQIAVMQDATAAAGAATSAAELAATNATTAAGTANAAAAAANTTSSAAASAANAAAAQASAAASTANAAASSINGLTIETAVVPAGTLPQAAVSDVGGHKHLYIETQQGPQGAAFKVLGVAYATVAALEAAVPDPQVGDQYNVGSSPPYNIYRWTGTLWEDQGVMQGQDGAPGPNQITPDTDTTLEGLLKGAGGKAAKAVAGVDYVSPAPDAVSGNFAAWDSGGVPMDSGKKAADFASAEQGAKADAALPKAGGTMTGLLELMRDGDAHLYLKPGRPAGTVLGLIRTIPAGSTTMQACDDETQTNKRYIEVTTAALRPTLDEAAFVGDVVGGVSTRHRIYHAGMATPIPVTKGGTGATTKAAALDELGAMPIAGGTFAGQVTAMGGSLWLNSAGQYFNEAGMTAASGTALAVYSNGKVVKASSSRRYKEDVRYLDGVDSESSPANSETIYQLRPVSYEYKEQLGVRQVGLIAEDVEAIDPALCVYNAAGEVESVKYQDVGILLLREVQRLRAQVAAMSERIAQLEAM